MLSRNRIIPMFALVLVSWPVTVCEAQRPKKVVTASIRKVDTVGRMISIEINKELFARDFKVAPDAAIQVADQKAELDDLKPGMKITASVDFQAETVTKILAQALPREKSPSKPDSKEPDEEMESEDDPAKNGEGSPAKRVKKPDEPPISTNGEVPNELSGIDEIVKEYMSDQRIRGGAVVVVKDGRCVMARGYGHADKDRAAAAEPTTLFPIAGVSKVITGIAALKLQEENKLKLRDKFADMFPLPLPDDQKKLMQGSKYSSMEPYDLLKDHRDLDSDPFLTRAFGTAEGRKGATMALKGMPDPDGFVFVEDRSYPFLDIEYLLLGRVIAKMAGGRYEPYVQRAVLEGRATNKPRVEVSGKVVLEEKDRSKGRKRAGKGPDAEEPAFDGVAFVQGEGKEAYEEPSMNFDAAGGWLFSAMDLAKVAASLDETAQPALLSAESLNLLFEKPSSVFKSGDDKEAKPDKGKQDDSPAKANSKKKESSSQKDAKRRVATSGYFTAGWTVLAPKGKDAPPSPKLRRYARSGPASVTSDDGLHVVILLTTPQKESKGEHPLMVKLDKEIAKITSWPSVDYFKTAPSTQTPADPSMPSPTTSTDSPEPSVPQLPVVAGLAGKIETMVRQVNALQAEFVANGGAKLMAEVRAASAGSGDFQKIAQKMPDVVARNTKLLDKLVELIPNALVMRTDVPADKPDQLDTVAAMSSYVEGRGRVARAISDLLGQPGTPEAQLLVFQRLVTEEESMLRWYNVFLNGYIKSFLRAPKPSMNAAEFQASSEWLLLHIAAGAEERDAVLANRRPRMDAITAKGAGATAVEQAILPTMLKEINEAARLIVEEQKQLREKLAVQLETESKAGSKFVAIWEAAVALADAQNAFTQYVSTMGGPDSNPADGVKLITSIREAQKRLTEAAKAPAPPAEGAPAADAAPAEPKPQQ